MVVKRGRMNALEERIKNLEDKPEALVVDMWKAGILQGWQLFASIIEQAPEAEYRLTKQQIEMIRIVYPEMPAGIPTAIFDRPLIIVDVPFSDTIEAAEAALSGNKPGGADDA